MKSPDPALEAHNLRELLTIRRHHEKTFARLPGCLGSAVGYKYNEQEHHLDVRVGPDGDEFIPAVMVFVARKRPRDEIRPADRIPPILVDANGRWCHTDVVEGRIPLHPEPPPPLSPANRRLLKHLHDDPDGVIGGTPILSPYAQGTTACVVRRRRDQALGLLTNWHIAGFDGADILRVPPRLQNLGVTDGTVIEQLIPPPPLRRLLGRPRRLDAGFVRFTPAAAKTARPGVFGLKPLGSPYLLDLDTMGPINRPVVGVGQTRGLQRGRVMAYGYEWQPEPGTIEHYATDYLLLGDDDQPFALEGDSGKLVVTDDRHRQPLALLWGGQRQHFWNAAAQECWAYASDLSSVLTTLDLEIWSA